MPTYEYACPSCEQITDVVQSMRDAALTNCPKCGKPGVKRLIGRGAGIIFKGTGFYETDYKRVPEKKETAAPATTPAAADSSKPASPAPAASGSASASSSKTTSSSSPAPAPAKTN